jgi:hypothetical protein
MQLLDNVISYLITEHVANAKDSDIFKDYAPKSPDDCIIVYEYQGTPPAMFTKTSVRNVQIVGRSKKNVIAKQLAWNCYNVMSHDDMNITLGGKQGLIAVKNTPVKIGVDEQGRMLFAFNMAITIEQS